MKATRIFIWHIALAIMIAPSVECARAGEVTAVGSPYESPPEETISFCAPAEKALGPSVKASGGSVSVTVDPEPVGDRSAFACWLDAISYAQRPLDQSWYGRFDYYSWKEQLHTNTNSTDEHGTLYTVGYVRASGAKRVRVEFFTGTMAYTPGDLPRSDGLLDTTSRQVGVRTEFELLWDWNTGCSTIQFFSGLGARFWVRDIQDEQLASGGWLSGYQDNWFTLYPYIGMERKWEIDPCMDAFFSCRIGATAYTRESIPEFDGLVLNPQACMTGQVEFGLRYEEHLFFSVYFDAMTWARSPWVDGNYQPKTQMYTTGLKLGLSF